MSQRWGFDRTLRRLLPCGARHARASPLSQSPSSLGPPARRGPLRQNVKPMVVIFSKKKNNQKQKLLNYECN